MLPDVHQELDLVSGVLRGERDNVEAARRDPNAFVEFCCTDPDGRPLVQSHVHREIQDFLSANSKAMVELPRDHGKTVQVCARVLWELGRNPALRIKIVCATERIAEDRGRFLRRAIEENCRLREVFPKLQPGQPWAANCFSVERPAELIGPSVSALGVGAGLTGTRADLLVCDDIVDVKSLTSVAERARVKAFFRDNLMNLLEPDGRCWCLCTPWHANDLNAELKRDGAFAHLRRAIGATERSVWPERWPRARLIERRREIGSASFARGYRLLPLNEDVMTIKAEWVRFWDSSRPRDEPGLPPRDGDASGPGTPGLITRSVMATLPEPDLRSGSATRHEWSTHEDWERIILAVDPAVSAKPDADLSALVVLARGPDGIVRCRESMARRVTTPDLVRLIEDADRRWQPELVLFESNAAFLGVKDLLVRHANFGYKVRGITQTRSKSSRVAAFSVAVENGTFHLKGRDGAVDPGQQALFDEMTTFPVADHDDLLDAAAMGTEYLLNVREPRAW
jgi:predicted phage terminase large subunit-like protein